MTGRQTSFEGHPQVRLILPDETPSQLLLNTEHKQNTPKRLEVITEVKARTLFFFFLWQKKFKVIPAGQDAARLFGAGGHCTFESDDM